MNYKNQQNKMTDFEQLENLGGKLDASIKSTIQSNIGEKKMDREYDRHKVLHFVRENYQEYFSKDAEGFFGIFLSCLTQDEKLFFSSRGCLKLSWDTGMFLRDFVLKFNNEFNEFEQYQICMKFFNFMQYENDEIREGFFDLGQKIAEGNNLFKEVA